MKPLSTTHQYWLDWITAFNREATEEQLQAFVDVMEEQLGETIANMEVFDSLGMKIKGEK